MREALRLVGVYLLASLIYAGFALLSAFPYHPHTAWGWVLLFLLAFPLWLVGEWLGHVLIGNRFARVIDSYFNNRGWLLRGLYLFLVAVLAFAAFAAAWIVLAWLGLTHL